MFNTNMFHNALNVLIALSGVLIAVLLAIGCTQLDDGALECSQSSVGPGYAAAAVAALSTLKIVINIVRDGIAGLIKPQPPIDR